MSTSKNKKNYRCSPSSRQPRRCFNFFSLGLGWCCPPTWRCLGRDQAWIWQATRSSATPTAYIGPPNTGTAFPWQRLSRGGEGDTPLPHSLCTRRTVLITTQWIRFDILFIPNSSKLLSSGLLLLILDYPVHFIDYLLLALPVTLWCEMWNTRHDSLFLPQTAEIDKNYPSRELIFVFSPQAFKKKLRFFFLAPKQAPGRERLAFFPLFSSVSPLVVRRLLLILY